MIRKRLIMLSALLLLSASWVHVPADVQKKVVLQAFWWDYWNENYPNSYANYLTELAPRLKEYGINAVWVPAFCKNTGTNAVGYSPFDHYDLGDKYQKGGVETRFGSKDDVLRMIAVMHSNGIEVLGDIVLNHVDGAGANGGAGGEDPAARDSKWKNFRYVSYATPANNNSAEEYWSRSGRWSKNWPNFHPNEGHNSNSGDWCSDWWGPDICYYEGAYGQSSNAIGFNPVQEKDYMRKEARKWMMWFKKQTAIDGYRWDAVKHFPEWVQQDLLWNVKYSLPDWCKGGETMLSFGEFVGSKGEMDNYCQTVQYANGGNEFLMGSFDFALRGGLQGMVSGGGYFDIGSLPSAQQNMRYNNYAGDKTHRLVTFVNGHDTFRPKLDDNGNYVGWDTGNEIGGHIDPFSPRLGAAYATIMAMDGNPCVYMEDLFNLSNGKRYTHNPTSSTDLPVRSQIRNLIWCHQNLDFKYGDYKVRYQTGDLLVIEREGRAIIAITDNGSNDQEVWIDTGFRDKDLKDYSGGVGDTRRAYSDGRFQVKVTKADNGGLGYSVWAPTGKEGGYVPYRSKTTTQEWEMADDLGDSHCESLGQGGALPKNSTAQRLVGKIYVEQGKTIDYAMHPETTGKDITLAFYDLDGNRLSKKNGTADITGTWTASYSGWVAMKVWNTTNTNDGQKCWLKVSYQAPATVTNTMADRATTRASIWTANGGSSDWTDCKNWEQGKVPTTSSKVVIPENAPIAPKIQSNVTIKSLRIEKGRGNQDHPDILVTGTLNVTESSSSLEGTAFICGTGTVSLGARTGDFNLCPGTWINNMENEILFEIYPNPVNSTSVLRYSLSQGDAVVIYLKDATGRTISSMNEGIKEIGSHEKTLDLSWLPQGVYFSCFPQWDT